MWPAATPQGTFTGAWAAACHFSFNRPSQKIVGHRLKRSPAPASPPPLQTHTTPVLLAVGERAEMATDQYLPVSPILEGVVILRPNPDYVDPAAASGSGGK